MVSPEDFRSVQGDCRLEFKTARGARATLAQSIAEMRAGAYALKRFSVPGIPGARAAVTSAATRKAAL